MTEGELRGKLAAAEPGDVIQLEGPVHMASPLEIPPGVTLVGPGGAKSRAVLIFRSG